MVIDGGQSASDIGDGRETICASVMNYVKINRMGIGASGSMLKMGGLGANMSNQL